MDHCYPRQPSISTARPCLLCLLCLLIGGCATSIAPLQDLPDMRSIYELYATQGSLEGESDFRQLRAAALRNTGRVAQPPPPAGGAAADALFPRLYNPVLHMYIFPHLVGEEGLPVPGYSTAFRLYERDHFAQPGEETSP